MGGLLLFSSLPERSSVGPGVAPSDGAGMGLLWTEGALVGCEEV